MKLSPGSPPSEGRPDQAPRNVALSELRYTDEQL